MIDATSGLAERAAALRSAFDRAFAAPSRADAAIKLDLIAIRVGMQPCAIRLADVTGLFADRKITPVPGSDAALLGIAGFRGALVPVYGLSHAFPSAAGGSGKCGGHSGIRPPRWLVAAAAAPVAFAFDAFEGHLRAPVDAILPRQRGQLQDFAPAFIRTGDVVRPVIDLSAVIAAFGATTAAKPTFMQE